jgi:hypothetical protein
MLLYRITYRSALQANSVVRPLVAQPEAGDQIALDAHTVVTILKVLPRAEGDTIAAELIAEEGEASDEKTTTAETASSGVAPADPSTTLP